MKTFNLIVKILTALAAIAGVIYLIATYGDKIVAWAKEMMAKCPCCAEEAPEEEAATEEVPAEEVPAEEPAAEEAPAEEAADSAPVASEEDFEA